ncbi:MAG TPA: hypothetical protein ENI61_06530 [Ignavibacteria bacterium]|nr:hypothetical protein [Ignavibacteria bacterium]
MKYSKYLIAVIFSFVFLIPVNGQNMRTDSLKTNRTQMMSNNKMGGNMMGKMHQKMMQGKMHQKMMQGKKHQKMMQGKKHNMMRGKMQKMRQSGMGMMNLNNPMKKYMMLINKISNMSGTLSLTKSQKKQLVGQKINFLKRKIDYQASIAKEKIDLWNLLQNKVSASKVRDAMQQIARNKININILTYETAIEMENVLNTKQKQALKTCR